MFADNTKIFRVIRNSEDHTALQYDLNLLYEWPVHWQLKFNISKCKHIHFGPIHHYGSYYLNGIIIDSVKSHKDLGVILDHQLKSSTHTPQRLLQSQPLITGIDQEIFRLSRF